MDMIKYIVKRLLLSVLILFGVSVIIYALARMMPTDYVDNQYSSAVSQGTMTQDDVDRIKELYGLSMPDAYLKLKLCVALVIIIIIIVVVVPIAVHFSNY